METWYRVNRFNSEIVSLEVTRSTKDTLFYNMTDTWTGKTRERRERKNGSYETYFSSWREAHEFLRERLLGEIEGHHQSIRRLLKSLAEVESAHDPSASDVPSNG